MDSIQLNHKIKKVLFISNGHGEDLSGSLILKALRDQHRQLEIVAMPLVGQGNAYRNLGVEIIGPTGSLPSGGFINSDRMELVKDVRAGLLGLLWQQIRAIQQYCQDDTAIFVIGDVVVLLSAYLTKNSYTVFLISTSAHYENRIKFPLIPNLLLKSNRCQKIFTRDKYTAEILNAQGFTKASFVGFPAMDALALTGKDLELLPNSPLLAFLPGSRLPEAGTNLQLLLDLAIATTPKFPQGIQFRAAVTSNLFLPDTTGMSPLQRVAEQRGWEYHSTGCLTHPQHQIRVLCFCDAFADILHQCDLVVGMAGTAIEQAVGLGKPVIQIPSAGPQFTYTFAEAQMRLLGLSIQTIGTKPATPETIAQAAAVIQRTLEDKEYLERARMSGLERVGGEGGAAAMARIFAEQFLKTNLL